MTVNYEKCINCGKCTKHCSFLKKYNINLKEYANLAHLAFNCYLCGECKRVCPVDIDGRQLSLDLREKRIKEGYNLYLNGYGALLLEKRNYIFKNYANVNSKVALFPGCNFPAYYPKTTMIISEKLKENFGISTIFDCCGKPISDLNLKKEKGYIRDRLNNRFKELGIEELILLCPNCYYYLKENLDIKISMIYEHDEIMESLIFKDNSNKIEGLLFLPCPDKDSRTIYKMLEKYIDNNSLQEITNIQCCGAGGCASIKEKELTKDLQDGFKAYDKRIYLYCATCAGMITKSNVNVEHILCKLLNTDEKISTGIATVKNRALFSIKRQR
ncbi:(Fe-S)-binding protein [Schnuerera sp.]|uniref:(Fe-S)-binding protein n=1 Tax=Schnuerera sp. TaxID=2794844 RepID=UPI002C3F0DD5|nr:(Fe-S)-binding protein [Schnuerera sp.]HSH37041.1 (Fe-S)-binding protein [Schnuerera sp.]